MNVTEYMFGSNDKLTDIKYLLEKYKLKNDECAFLGNDTSDIKCLEYFNKSFALMMTQILKFFKFKIYD